MLDLLCLVLVTIVVYFTLFASRTVRRVQKKVDFRFSNNGLKLLTLSSVFRWLGLVERFTKHWWTNHLALCDERCLKLCEERSAWHFGPKLRREYFEIICFSKQITYSYQPLDGSVVGLVTLTRIYGKEPFYKITLLRMGSIVQDSKPISAGALKLFILAFIYDVDLPVVIDLQECTDTNLPDSVFLDLGFMSTPIGLSFCS